MIAYKEVLQKIKENIKEERSNNRELILLKELKYNLEKGIIKEEEIEGIIDLIKLGSIKIRRDYKPKYKINELIEKIKGKKEIEVPKIRENEKIETIIGEITIPSFIGIVGLNGVGKTLLGLEILENLRQKGENTLFIQMEDIRSKKESVYKGNILYVIPRRGISEIKEYIKENLATAVVLDSLIMISDGNVINERELIKEIYALSYNKTIIVINHINKNTKREINSKTRRIKLSDSIGSSLFENLLDIGIVVEKITENKIKAIIEKNRFGRNYEVDLELMIDYKEIGKEYLRLVNQEEKEKILEKRIREEELNELEWLGEGEENEV
jgi:predicted ATP-dependent serine protease